MRFCSVRARVRLLWKIGIPLLASVASFFVYAMTSAPGLGLVDSGELTAASATLGIAHPTGYPLYVILGRIWLMVLTIDPARSMVLFSCASAAAVVGIMAGTMTRWVESRFWRDDANSAILSALGAFGIALTPVVWGSIIYAEVYPLTFLLAAIIVALVVIAKSDPNAHPRCTLLACYVWGLGFGNHLTIIWLFPLIVYALIAEIRSSGRPYRTFAIYLLVTIAGASVNLFLPVRSGVDPRLDWSDPETIQNIYRHLSAWQYRVWMFTGGLESFLEKMTSYARALPSEMGWGMCAAAVAVIGYAVRFRDGLLIALLLSWVLGVIYNLGYDIPDIGTYFMTVSLPLFYAAVFVMLRIVDVINSKLSQNRKLRSIAWCLILSFGSANLYASRSYLSTHDAFAERYSRELLRTLPQNALVIQGNWDVQSPVIYLQEVLKYRRDVVMLDLNLLQRPWYIEQEKRAHPEVFKGIDGEIENFGKQVAPFESGELYDSRQVESAYLSMVNGIIKANLDTRPVYVRDMSRFGHPGISAGFPKIQAAYFTRIGDRADDELVLDADSLLEKNRNFTDRERYLLQEAAISSAMQARYAMDRSDTTKLKQAIRTSAALMPADSRIAQLKAAADQFLKTARNSRQ